MLYRHSLSLLLSAVLLFASVSVGVAQQSRTQSDVPVAQRLSVMRKKLEAMRQSLKGAIAATGEKEKGKVSADDPGQRLRGLDKEASSVLNEVTDLSTKQERLEKYDASSVDRLESTVADLETRVQAGLAGTAGARSQGAAVSRTNTKKKKKGLLPFGLFSKGGDEDKYTALIGEVAPGRDRVLFEEAAKQVRKGNHEEGRLLFNTIITTYPDSAYLPMAKLAIADSFFLEGSTSSLIQASNAYQDWVTFFPTNPLADRAMLKVAESEMRQMELPNRDFQHSRKAEQRLKVLLQQYPNTTIKQTVNERLIEVQENLAMHNLGIADFYLNRQKNRKGGLKGAQSRLREITEKYPNFSYMDKVLYELGATYLEEEEPDEAAKFFQQIARDYPNSEFAGKAKEQLGVIGAQVPEPDPIAKKKLGRVKEGRIGGMMKEVLGRADVTTDKNGVLISKDTKAGNDLIDLAIKNQGQLPDTPQIYRTPPAKTNTQVPVQPSKPSDKQSSSPQGKETSGPAGSTSPASDATATSAKP
jgi:outer membrane protein assembly factor BamD